MRVACPECSAAYELPPALAERLGEGRPLRCARCGHTWKPVPPAGNPPAPEGTAPEAPGGSGPEGPQPADSQPEDSKPRAPRPDEPQPEAPQPGTPQPAPPGREPAPPGPVTPARILAAAWAASFLLLAGLATAAWHWRIDIVEAWPPAARAFMALGLVG